MDFLWYKAKVDCGNPFLAEKMECSKSDDGALEHLTSSVKHVAVYGMLPTLGQNALGEKNDSQLSLIILKCFHDSCVLKLLACS